MEDKSKEIDFIKMIKTIWSQRRKVIKWSIIGMVVGIVISISTPDVYTSTAKIAPESSEKSLSSSAGALAGVMGLSGNMGRDGLNEMLYPEIIESTPFIIEFADIQVEYEGQKIPFSEYMLEYNKFPWWSYVIQFPAKTISWIKSIGKPKIDTLNVYNSPSILYSFTTRVSQSIKLESDSKTGVITLATSFQNPKIAKLIADSVVSKLQTYMNNYRTAKTASILESNLRMMNDAKLKYYKTDQEYAEAKDKNRDLVSQAAIVKLDRLVNEKMLAFQIYQQLALQVETDRVKLHEEKVIASIIEPATIPLKPSSPKTMLILIAFTFLFGFGSSVVIVLKDLIKNN